MVWHGLIGRSENGLALNANSAYHQWRHLAKLLDETKKFTFITFRGSDGGGDGLLLEGASIISLATTLPIRIAHLGCRKHVQTKLLAVLFACFHQILT